MLVRNTIALWKLSESVYKFYSALACHYLEIEMITDEEMVSSPWASALEIAED